MMYLLATSGSPRAHRVRRARLAARRLAEDWIRGLAISRPTAATGHLLWKHVLAVMVNDPVAAAPGWPRWYCRRVAMFRALPTVLMVYIGDNMGFVAHYALLGDRTAAAMNGLLAVSTLVAIWLVRQPRLRSVYYR